MMNRRTLLLAGCASTGLLALHRPAFALFGGGSVNLGPLIIVMKEILALTTDIKGLTEQVAIPIDLAGLASAMDALRAVQERLQLLQTIGWKLEQVNTSFDNLFPENMKDMTFLEAVGLGRRWINTIRQTTRHAMQVQAQAAEAMEWDQTQTQLILAASTGGGPATALQAANQLNAVQIRQMSQLQSLMATQSRLLSTKIAEENQMKERAERLRAEYQEDSDLSDSDPLDIGR